MASILVVEDNASLGVPLCSLLEADGHQVAYSQDAASAVAIAQSDATLDLALVDYWLEKENAAAVLATLCDKRPDMPVILITGGSPSVSVETTSWLGALDGIDDFLQKPFSQREIRAVIQKFCG